jgi:Predicted thiol oxidoreductase
MRGKVLGVPCLVIFFVIWGLTPSAIHDMQDIQASTIGAGEESINGRYFGDPIQGLTASELQEFNAGFNLFVKIWTTQEGVGPNINARSCVVCHRVPVPGGSGTTRDTFVVRSPSVKDAAGGTVFPRFEVHPDGSLHRRSLPKRVTVRRTPPLFGLGLLEAVPVYVLLEYADPNDADGDGISGRLLRVGEEFGRFGWKGNVPTIEAFVEEAFEVEIGLQSKPRQAKNLPGSSGAIKITPTQIRLVSQFVRLLGAPRQTMEPGLSKGRELFFNLDCAKCHRPSLTTGTGPAPFGNQKIFPYTDLLLHDMGPELSDGLGEDGISGQEFRTPPLWGIASIGPPYLHDGRALTVHEAILAHRGEAKISAEKYNTLAAEDRAALLRFVNSL